ncbi:MAG TPA: molybdate ABC transporter substrate-binding protein [Gaiellaceae bacterium]|nr:molybdate ABC transporter substrate-binding protein [Gaiellaceae bacterium]
MRLAAAGAVLAAVVAVAAATARTDTPRATVYAAASLTDAFPKIAPSARFSFAGSNTLAAQIRQGAPADVFAAANVKLPYGLYGDGFCSKPVVFTRNALVLIVPRSNPAHIRGVSGVTRRGVKLVIADKGVPVGDYTLQVLAKLRLNAALRNVVSRETDVREVLAKVALGEADAGFVYSTDARTVPKKVTVLRIPARGRPNVEYGLCVVLASHQKDAAQRFVRRVLGPGGQAVLRHFGFLPRKP